MHRDSGNQVSFFLNGVALGTGTVTGTANAIKIGLGMNGNLERVALYSAQKTGGDLAAIRAAFMDGIDEVTPTPSPLP